MGWKPFWVWVGKEHRIQYLAFLWAGGACSAHAQPTLFAGPGLCPVPASCPWCRFCVLCLGMEPGHPHRRRAWGPLQPLPCWWNNSGRVFNDWQHELVILLKIQVPDFQPCAYTAGNLLLPSLANTPCLSLADVVCVIVPPHGAPHCQQQECCSLSVPLQPWAGV